jgi:hypothetical protein
MLLQKTNLNPVWALIGIIILLTGRDIFSQPAPSVDENIPYLITFGGNSSTTWGDDDFCQIFFFVIPTSQNNPVYLRVFDPDTGGDLDEAKGEFNTVVSFSIYGGNGCWSDTAAQSVHPRGNYRSGYLLTSKSFGVDPKYDKQWYSFGPINPFEGENVTKLGGHVFKIIAQGLSGDDGNIYKYFLSTGQNVNNAVKDGNLFTYKYHFRLPDNQKQICQIYPYVDDKTISVEVSDFDWDNDGTIRIFSIAKDGIFCDVSGDNNWKTSIFPIAEDERNSSLEIQFMKNQSVQIKNNNVVVTVKNQYGVSLPFFVVPIGGIPVYSPKIKMR